MSDIYDWDLICYLVLHKIYIINIQKGSKYAFVQKQLPEMLYKKVVLNSFAMITGKDQCWSLQWMETYNKCLFLPSSYFVLDYDFE